MVPPRCPHAPLPLPRREITCYRRLLPAHRSLERVALLCRSPAMSIGPFLELPNTAVSQLCEFAATKRIRVRLETPDNRASSSLSGLYIFCNRLGRIQGHWRT